MNRTCITVPEVEWLTVARVVDAVHADDARFHPTLNRGAGASQSGDHWTVHGADGTVVRVEHHGIADGDLNLSVPVGLIRHAACMAHAGQAVELIVDDRYIEVRAEDGGLALFDRLPNPPEMSGYLGDESASAVLSGDKLHREITGSLQVPNGLSEDVYWPALKVGIKDGRVMLSRDWSMYGLGQSTFSEVALTSTSTEAPVVGIIPYSIRNLSRTCCAPESEVRISIGAEYVCFDNPDLGWMALAPVVETGAVRWTGAVESALTEAELEWTSDDSGHIAVVHWGEPAIVISFHDSCPETLRIALPVAEHLDESLEVHQQINLLNCAKVGICFALFPGGHLVAFTDLPCCRHGELVFALNHLRGQTVGLGVLFGSTRDDG
jgi:hypothetical protein